jgi:hypothetical protein
MRKIIALALLFVLSLAGFGQKITIQTQKTEAKPTPQTQTKAQKAKPKIAVKPKKTPAKTAVKTVKTKPKASVKPQKTTAATEAKPKTELKAKADIKPKTDVKPKADVKPKTDAAPQIAIVEAKTADGQDIILKADGTWAYKKPEPTPKPSPVAKASPVAKPTPTLVTAQTAPTPGPVAKESSTPAVKPSPIAKIKPSPTPSSCDLALSEAPSIRGLRLGMTRDEADGIIPGNRITIVNSSDIVAYPQYSNARGFENVYQISAEFFDNRLSALEIVYDPDNVKWKSAKEFAQSLSENFKLSPNFWKYDARNSSFAEMQCREFAIRIDAAASQISLQKTNAAQKTNSTAETQNKIFRP